MCTSTVAATTLLRPLSRHLRWFVTPIFPAPPFHAQPFLARPFHAPPSSFSRNCRIAVPPR
ncbi:hypothetical protein DEO72_LG7g1862 [Vigna unguiculata]|uniref:Uncharacterized protein n=1 Tax=Vigna unguiculata TaxID=3917 RepID=A0A4D6MIZ8_VIGUN|nr:hypothetical protein DEO72_LG7g1862 [Vigna unguiculata]